MIHYGIELEFFVFKDEELVPAYKATNNLDGNPVVGEIRTDIFTNKVDLIFDLAKKLYVERVNLAKKGFTLELRPSVKAGPEFRKALRKDFGYCNLKTTERLEEFSIYLNGETSRESEEVGVYQASLQINVSDNQVIEHNYVDKDNKDRKFSKSTSSLFNFYELIQKWDREFEADITQAKRIPGVYTIKDGDLGKRVEYRSLPNCVNYEKLIELF